jgi:hypothetical protein
MDVIQPSRMIGRWVIVGLWVCPLDNGVCLCPEDTEVKGVVASSPSEVFGCVIKSDLFHLDVPSIFQCFEDSLEVSFCSLPIRGCSRDSVFWDVEDSVHDVVLGVFRVGNDLSEVADGLKAESMGFLEVSSEGRAIIESSNTQGTLKKA